MKKSREAGRGSIKGLVNLHCKTSTQNRLFLYKNMDFVEIYSINYYRTLTARASSCRTV